MKSTVANSSSNECVLIDSNGKASTEYAMTTNYYKLSVAFPVKKDARITDFLVPM